MVPVLRSILYTLLLLISLPVLSYSQTKPLLYFCERYETGVREVNISDVFTTGYLTVMVKSETPLGLTDVTIQYDRWDGYDFIYYKAFDFSIDPEMDYVFFSKNDESDMSFDQPGFFRVSLLDESQLIVTSSIVQIIK